MNLAGCLQRRYPSVTGLDGSWPSRVKVSLTGGELSTGRNDSGGPCKGMPVKKKPKNVRRKSMAKIEDALSKLTVKERCLVENIIAGKSRTEAAIRAGYDVGNPDSRKNRKKACDIASHVLEKPEVKEAFSTLLDQHNLSISRLLTKINEGLEATKTTGHIKVPDYMARFKYIEIALSLHGLPGKKKVEGAGEDLPYHERIKRIWARIEGEAPVD